MPTTEHRCVFDDVPRTARGHLGLYFHWAAFRLIHLLREHTTGEARSLDQVFADAPFLAPYWSELTERFPQDLAWGDASKWMSEQLTAWEEGAPEHLPLISAGRELDLDHETILALVLAGAVEEDPGFETLFARLQGDGHGRPSVALIHSVTESDAERGLSRVVRALVESGLCEVPNPEAPRPHWHLRVAQPHWDAIRGRVSERPLNDVAWTPRHELPAAEDLALDDAARHQVRELAGLMGTGDVGFAVIRGSEGSQRLEVLAAIAASLGRGILVHQSSGGLAGKPLEQIGALAVLAGGLPIFILEPGPGESTPLPEMRGYRGPIGVVLGREGGLQGTHIGRTFTIELAGESPALRHRLWESAFNGANGPTREAADRFTLSARYIGQCASMATSTAKLSGRADVTMDDIRLAVRSVNRRQLDTLATRLDDGNRWRDLVVHESTASALYGLEQRCRFREQLPAALGDGFPGGLNRGVRALLEGPSGTGKTLAVRILGAELGRDVYRVDLASVVNKYIGETEKNLSRILNRAEELDVILLLDEGDALLTRRTDVRSANDRYANLETNYLLQRLETYVGILVVTTNGGDRIDPAFRRRMDVSVRFYPPDPLQRLRLWSLHLPQDHVVSQDSLRRFAALYELTGGQIRNASIHATLSALEGGRGRVTRSEVLAAIEIEYRKAGAVFPTNREAPQRSVDNSVAQFLAGIE